MSVELDPAELGFKRPFTHEVSQILRLRNPNADPVAFKVKTTAPKQYCVRPNSGRIEPNRYVEVQVLLQAMKEDPPADARCRDKFLVQSVSIGATSAAATAEPDASVAQIWSSIEQTAKSSIQEKKIRVTWLPATGAATAAASTAAAAATNGQGHHHQDDEAPPPAYASSPSPTPVTPRATPARTMGSTAATEMDKTVTKVGDSAVAAISSVTGLSPAELERQLQEAKAKIAQLQAQAAEATGLRQRKGGSDEKSAAAGGAGGSTVTLQKTAPPAGGVSVPIVALLCVLSFMLAYFFF